MSQCILPHSSQSYYMWWSVRRWSRLAKLLPLTRSGTFVQIHQHSSAATSGRGFGRPESGKTHARVRCSFPAVWCLSLDILIVVCFSAARFWSHFLLALCWSFSYLCDFFLRSKAERKSLLFCQWKGVLWRRLPGKHPVDSCNETSQCHQQTHSQSALPVSHASGPASCLALLLQHFPRASPSHGGCPRVVLEVVEWEVLVLWHRPLAEAITCCDGSFKASSPWPYWGGRSEINGYRRMNGWISFFT